MTSLNRLINNKAKPGKAVTYTDKSDINLITFINLRR